MKNVNRLLWIFTVAIHVVMVLIITAIYNSQFQSLQKMQLNATVAVAEATSFSLTNPPPTFTATATATATATPLPTATMPPTSTPIACFSNSSGTIYLQPSRGRTKGSIQVTNASLPLYFRLQDEDWWLTAVKNSDGITMNGWIHTDSLTNAELCANLEFIGLEAIIPAPIAPPYVSDTFSTFDYEWLAPNGEPSDRSSKPGLSSLYIRSGDGRPVTSRLDQVEIRGSFTFLTSLKRNHFSPNSYVGIRWTSVSDPNQFVELRIDAFGCNAIWVTYEKNYPSIPLGNMAACGNDDVEDYMRLNYFFDSKTLQLSGDYNDASLPMLKVEGSFDSVQLDMIVFYGEVEFDYVLIAQIQ